MIYMVKWDADDADGYRQRRLSQIYYKISVNLR